jgi:hypothetical protein
MEEPKKAEAEKEEPVKWIQVHQQKGNYFRVIHADGVWCSMSPGRFLHLTFYSERYPLPKSISFPVNKSGAVMDEDLEKRETLKDWVREMEVDVVLSLAAAKSVREGLDNYIKFAEALAEQKPNA